MKITLTKKQREKGQRVIKRFKKMCKAGLVVLAGSYLAESAVFQVVKDQIAGNAGYGPMADEQINAMESAFID